MILYHYSVTNVSFIYCDEVLTFVIQSKWRKKMEDSVGVRFAECDVQELELLVRSKVFMSVSDAVRDLTRRGLRDEMSKLRLKAC